MPKKGDLKACSRPKWCQPLAMKTSYKNSSLSKLQSIEMKVKCQGLAKLLTDTAYMEGRSRKCYSLRDTGLAGIPMSCSEEILLAASPHHTAPLIPKEPRTGQKRPYDNTYNPHHYTEHKCEYGQETTRPTKSPAKSPPKLPSPHNKHLPLPSISAKREALLQGSGGASWARLLLVPGPRLVSWPGRGSEAPRATRLAPRNT